MKLDDSAIPGRYEKMTNPLSAHGVNLIEARGHYEEHCAVCHADSGSDDPKFHGIMYPRPTDLRSEDTQEMSDGQLYWIIKNGIRWSGGGTERPNLKYAEGVTLVAEYARRVLGSAVRMNSSRVAKIHLKSVEVAGRRLPPHICPVQKSSLD